MGKIVVHDETVINRICEVSKNETAVVGLLVGQSTDQKDIVIHVAFTPKKENDENYEASGDKEIAIDKNKQKSKSHKDESDQQDNSEMLDEGWICQHAKQVTRMLPGGMDVLGIFIVASPDILNASQAKLRQILFSIYRNRKDCLIPSSEKILLQRCSITNKFICKTFDISDCKSTGKPADWKLQPDNLQWHQLDSRISMDLRVPVSRLSSKQSLLKQLLSGFLPFFKNIEESTALVNGRLRRMNELLDPSQDKKKGGRHDKSKPTQHVYRVDLLVPLMSNSKSVAEVTECCATMSIKGTVHCRAYVHNRSTVQEAIQALKNDVIRTLRSRCEIQCEDLLLIEEEQNDPSVIHELPKRVFAPLPNTSITVCDYLFHGDLASDSLDAFDELLNLLVVEDDIEMSLEQSPARRELLSPEETEDRLSEVGEQITNTGKSLLVPCVGMAAAVIVIGISYLWLKLNKTNDMDT